MTITDPLVNGDERYGQAGAARARFLEAQGATDLCAARPALEFIARLPGGKGWAK